MEKVQKNKIGLFKKTMEVRGHLCFFRSLILYIAVTVCMHVDWLFSIGSSTAFIIIIISM